MSKQAPTKGVTFSDLGLSEKLLAHLDKLKFTVPTPIQAKSIPIAVEGNDVIGIAQTGTGKTLAFSLPMLQQISRTNKQALVILPTRELAIQVDELISKLGAPFGVRQALLIGGAPMGKQIHQIRRRPHVIIATPGRIIDHIESRNITLNSVGILVLDEADRMLDMGFEPQIKRILAEVPRERQTMLFSATMPAAIVQIAKNHMKMPVRIEVARAGSVAEKVAQELFVVRKDDKIRLLETLLKEYSGTVLVFSRTKHGARKTCRAIQHIGHTAAELHSNLSLAQRKKSMEGFKSGKYRVLVATDIAARGIDVSDIELVVNFDLPDSPDDYVHRVGRTGRAGKGGRAISFIMPDQKGKVRIIERLVQQQLQVSPLPELPAHRSIPNSGGRDDSRRRDNTHGNRRRSFAGPSRSRRPGSNRSRRVHI